jgi:hypothetical protein
MSLAVHLPNNSLLHLLAQMKLSPMTTSLTTKVVHIRCLRLSRWVSHQVGRTKSRESTLTIRTQRTHHGQSTACSLMKRCSISKTKRPIGCTRSSSRGASSAATSRRRRTASISLCRLPPTRRPKRTARARPPHRPIRSTKARISLSRKSENSSPNQINRRSLNSHKGCSTSPIKLIPAS